MACPVVEVRYHRVLDPDLAAMTEGQLAAGVAAGELDVRQVVAELHRREKPAAVESAPPAPRLPPPVRRGVDGRSAAAGERDDDE